MTSENFNRLITTETGSLLCVKNSAIAVTERGDDSAIWRLKGNVLQSTVDSAISLEIKDKDPSALTLGHELLDNVFEQQTFKLQTGPSRLPSEHLQELKDSGITVLKNVLDSGAISRIKERASQQRAKNHGDEDPFDGHFWMMSSLLWSADIARACSNPIALWLMQEYMSTEDIHFCHQPVITTLKPADKLKGTLPEGGWHSDYPYHPGVFPNEDWPSSPVLGVQFNTCIDPFTLDTAGTQFVPGSHLSGKWPPIEMNLGGTTVGTGLHENVQQMLAPAGSSVIYDARTWHRACYELNVSGKDRLALLNAVAPAWVLPMMDKKPISKVYPETEIPGQLTERERRDIDRLCHSDVKPTPDDKPDLQVRLAAR